MLIFPVFFCCYWRSWANAPVGPCPLGRRDAWIWRTDQPLALGSFLPPSPGSPVGLPIDPVSGIHPDHHLLRPESQAGDSARQKPSAPGRAFGRRSDPRRMEIVLGAAAVV